MYAFNGHFSFFLPASIFYISEIFLYIFYLFLPNALWEHSLIYIASSLIHSSPQTIILFNKYFEFIISSYILCTQYLQLCFFFVLPSYACWNIHIFLLSFNDTLYTYLNICLALIN